LRKDSVNLLKTLIHKITGGLTKLSRYLVSFGPFGLLAIAFLDSVLIPMPGGVDAVLLLLSASRPSWMLIYVAAAVIGSTAGCVVLDYISR
jgi:membrane protein YqaA with SNARE-associated domain